MPNISYIEDFRDQMSCDDIDGRVMPIVMVESEVVWGGQRRSVKRRNTSASSGDNTVIPAVSGKSLVVLQMFLFATDDAQLTFEDGTGGTALTGTMDVFANAFGVLSGSTGSLILPYSPIGWFETSSGNLLNLSITGGDVEGLITYIEI